MLGVRIKDLRSQKGLLQKDVAAHLDISQQAVARWEKGQTEPDAETIKRLAEYFDCTTDYLLGKTDHPAAPDPCEDAPMAFMGNTSDLDINALEKIIKQAVKEAIEERKKSEKE